MKTRSLVLVGVIAFLLFAIATAPVATLHAWFGPKAAAVQPVGLDGSLAEGRMAGLVLNGRPLLGDLHWKLRPLQLLLARLGFHVDGGGEAITLDGGVALLPTGGIDLSNARVAGAMKAVLGLGGMGYLPVDGQAGLSVDSLKLRKGFPTSAEGRLQIDRLAWSLSKEPLVLGDFEGLITTEGDRIVARVSPLSGPLDVGGEIRLLTVERAYEVDLQIKPKSDAPAMVQNLVHSLGQPDAQGYWHVRTRGNLGPPQVAPAASPPPA